MLTLPGYGFLFFRLAADVPMPHWHEDKAPRAELPVLVMLEGWRTLRDARHLGQRIRALVASRTRDQLQREVLVPHMQSKQWFAAHGYAIESIELVEEDEWFTEDGSWLIALLRVSPDGLAPQTYFLPMGMTWEDAGEEALRALAPWTLARVRQRERMGVLHGAYGDPAFCRALVKAMGDKPEAPFAAGRLRFSATSAYADCVNGALDEEVRHPPPEQSNTAVLFGEKFFLKGYRLLHEGISPELEMGRFLTEASPYANAPSLAGAIEYLREDGSTVTLAVLHRYVEYQGDARHYVLDVLARHFDSIKADVPEGPVAETGYGVCLGMLRTLGERLGELHRALARPTGDPAFDPELVDAADAGRWAQRARRGRRRPGPAGAAPARAAGGLGSARPPRAGTPRTAAGTGGARCARRTGQRQDPLPWRLAPGPGAAYPRRLRHHRLPGRAHPPALRAPREALPAAGPGGAADLHRLCHAPGAAPGDRRPPRPARCAGGGSRRLDRGGHRRRGGRLSAGRGPRACAARRPGAVLRAAGTVHHREEAAAGLP